MVNDPIGDLIARIKNAAARGRPTLPLSVAAVATAAALAAA